MSWGKFEWIKELKNKPKYAEMVERLHSEAIVQKSALREKGIAITEVKTE